MVASIHDLNDAFLPDAEPPEWFGNQTASALESIPVINLDLRNGLLDTVAPVSPSADPHVRLNHLNNGSVGVMVDGEWFNFHNHVAIVPSDEIARKIEAAFDPGVVRRDDLPAPIRCEACDAEGKVFATKCLPLYSRHMRLVHARG